MYRWNDRAGRGLVLAGLCLFAAACASTPAESVPASGAEPVLAQSASPPPVQQSADYVIGPGDTLNVFVWQNPELSVSVPVRPDGKISTPLVQDMVAVGKTPSQLAADIEVVLSEYIRSPKVNIILTNPASALNQVRVIGQVTNPTGVPYREGMTVLDVVLQVGGLTPFAAGNRARLVRKIDGREEEIELELDDLVRKGDLRENLEVRPGDLIIVPESFF